MVALGVLFSMTTNAQHKCASHQNRMLRAAQNPTYAQRLVDAENILQNALSNSSYKRKADLITIPVVVHVVYHTDEENVSDLQIQSQIDVLNDDFQLLNADQLSSSHPFYEDAANCEIEFCLAKTDPDGKAHSGITRTFTDSTKFAGIDSEKFSSDGGHDNWDPTRYLNMWVCNLDEQIGTLGYASFPSDLEDFPDEDGVVIHFRCFGTTGAAGTGDFEDNDLGRTATHEVGHWLYLEHIWGDDECGSDKVNDTPPQEWDNGGCPDFPRNANNKCGSDKNGEMYMNYMDYVDDACMVMFTNGQNKRMKSAIDSFRPKLLKTPSCSTVSAIGYTASNNLEATLYPNPSKGIFSLDIANLNSRNAQVIITNTLGETVYTCLIQKQQGDITKTFNLESLAEGMYIIGVTTNNKSFTNRLVISK